MASTSFSRIFLDGAVLETGAISMPQGHRQQAQAIMHVVDGTLDFSSQLNRLLSAYGQVLEGPLKGYKPVFLRIFLSDALSQMPLLAPHLSLFSPSEVSVIQQPPLDGTCIALWMMLSSDVDLRRLPNGLLECSHGMYRDYYSSASAPSGCSSHDATCSLLESYAATLKEMRGTLKDHCMRTWFFVHDIDDNYQGVVKGRNEVFDQEDLTTGTHFLSSTGIGGTSAMDGAIVQMDAYAMMGMESSQVSFLYALDHLNRTSEYGVRFERGTRIDFGDRRLAIISGTASIDAGGEIVHPGDVTAQTLRMWENVLALLEEAECGFEDVLSMIVYLRNPSDYPVVRDLFKERFPEMPVILLWAPVCRPGWLIEMECMALKAQDKPFNAF